jgi:hypothetical protein
MLCNPGRIEVFDNLFPGLIIFPAVTLRYLHSYYCGSMPNHLTEAGETVFKRNNRCEGSAFQNGMALLLVSLPADSTTVPLGAKISKIVTGCKD